MSMLNEEEIKKSRCLKKWKDTNKEYLQALEKFFDATDNIKDENLKMEILYKMLKCDEILTRLAEENWKNNV